MNRLDVGPWVVDEEVVTAAGREVRALVAYEVRDDLIHTAVMLTPDLSCMMARRGCHA